MFMPRGQTAVVTEHDANAGTFKMTADPAVTKPHNRHGYLNGMSPEQRSDLMSLLDRVKEIDDPKERVNELRKKLEELRADPKQWQMSRYVESELAHTMNMFNIRPTTYTTELGLLKDAT